MLDAKDKIIKAVTQVWDFKGLSRDLVSALVDRASKQKDILINALAKEFTIFLSKINITEEAQNILEGMTLDIETTIRLKGKQKTSQKKTKKKVSLSRQAKVKKVSHKTRKKR